MKYLLCSALVMGLLLISAPADAGDENKLIGYWVMPDASALLEIRPDSGADSPLHYEIIIVDVMYQQFSSADGRESIGRTRVDHRNPDDTLRHRQLPGLRIGWGFSLDDGRLVDGRIYDPDSGKTYRAELELETDGLLRVRAFLGLSFIGQTMHWYPAQRFSSAARRLLLNLEAGE